MITILRTTIGKALALNRKLPHPIQNLNVSLYGAWQHWMRYGADFRKMRRFLAESEGWSAQEIEAYQRSELTALLLHCARRVPYYRDLFARLGLDERDLAAPDVLSRLPLLEKSTVRAAPKSFTTEGVRRWTTLSKGTSGTTGTPMIFICNRTEAQRYWAFADRMRHWAGSRVGLRRATMSAVPAVALDRRKPPYWRHDWIENKILFAIHNLAPWSVRDYARRMNAFRPEELIGYPSALSLLARLWPEDDPPVFHLKAIISSAETLFPFQRQVIESRFECRVSDQYSAGGEMGPVISNCEKGRYHEHPESGIIELLDSQGRPAPVGEPGEIVITGFINRTMPLIRYRTGDAATALDAGRCPCGRAFRQYLSIDGRIHDRLVLPDGRVLTQIASIVEVFPRTRECQFRQSTREKIRLDLVPEPGFGERDAASIRATMQPFLGPGVDFEIRLSDAIERSKQGKVRLVMSELEDARFDL